MHRTLRWTPLALALSACDPPPAVVNPMPTPTIPDVHDAQALVHAMHDRYAGSWYRTVSFTQQTTRVAPDGTESVETWREWLAVPGRLRIEMGQPEEQRGAIYASDSLFIIRAGQVARRIAQRNPLLLLGFDVYGQPPERTLEMIEAEGFDLSRFHRTTWQGRPAFVVGAAEGDSASKQFWVDAERLVFVRLLEPAPNNPARISDTRFNRYERLGGGWIAPEVEVLVGGKRVFFEEYSDIRADVDADSSLFVPERWTTARH
jgi:hypothetical protein